MKFKRAVDPPALDSLPCLSTRQLLGLRDRLLRLPESEKVSDLESGEIDPALLNFKDDPLWARLHQALKAELATREHMPTGAEKASRRTAQAQRGDHGRKDLPRPEKKSRGNARKG